ncbi:hypothetical protein [Fodinibius salsisoli]|uniref:Lipoprotein n=1 Tax=Fodinibius salsisoli TaxID=2820877 RepID=A0ABT3PHN4_9BACT|nr:hypothetical protein [Fodinibius salsisoli]MCW9705434.1 hypothetical protein [Fodinibius salsisoli]
MKKLFYLSVLIIVVGCSSAVINQPNYVDPTGTYELESDTREEGDEVYGYTGRIQVKRVTVNKILMTFGINEGAPNYNSGSFVDTLAYQNNRAVYRADPAIDPSCIITFEFTGENVTVKEEADNYTAGCGFGYGVVANGIFEKTASEEPTLRHPMTEQKIEK